MNELWVAPCRNENEPAPLFNFFGLKRAVINRRSKESLYCSPVGATVSRVQ
jgi:hypothetical protein